MKKKVKRIIAIMFALVFLMGNVAYAQDTRGYDALNDMQTDSTLLPPTIRSSVCRIQNVARSRALATAMAEITNQGSGVIGVFAETTMYISVDWARITVYLERWYEDIEDWQIEKSFEKEFYIEDEEDGVLNVATFETFVDDQPAGYYYRVKAAHEIETDDGWYEVKTTYTDGVMITSVP